MILKRYPSFLLGKCRCGCNENIPIKGKDYRLQKYKFNHQMRGNNHHNFRGGISSTSVNYIIIKMPWHPNAMKDGYILGHVWMMSRKIGRPLKKGEVVHHINGDKRDNRFDNIQLLESQKIHISIHNKKDMSDRYCIRCKSSTTYYNSKKGWYKWYIRDTGFICDKCYKKELYYYGKA